MIVEILTGLAKANLAVGLAILLVLGLRSLMRPRFGAQASYLLWLAPLAAGLAAAIPHRVAGSVVAPLMASVSATAGHALPRALMAPASPVPILLLGVWLIGAAAAGALFLRRQAAFEAALGPLQAHAFDGPGVLRAERAGVGPAVVGVLRPRIVTPADFEQRYVGEERRLILAHERTHLNRGDATINAFSCALQSLCWFNPLVHLAARLVRIDQELACDAAVIRCFPEARRRYAELLLKTQIATQLPPLGCHWPAGSEHPLKERIVMLKSPTPEAAMRIIGVVAAACLSLGAGSLAWAAAPAAPGPVIAKPAWIEKPVGADIAYLFPADALAKGVTARTSMSCQVNLEGRLENCKVGPFTVQADELSPSDPSTFYPEFAKAMLELSKHFRMEPASRDGVKVSGGTVRIPVIWSPHSQPAAPKN